jgi:hypothetical protein
MEKQELDKRLSKLGGLIWDAIHGDGAVTDLLFELADEKLSLDKVAAEDTRLDPNASDVIMGMEHDPEDLFRLRQEVPSHEWLKYALFNFALDWVMDQALMRMRLERKWPFQENDPFSKT